MLGSQRNILSLKHARSYSLRKSNFAVNDVVAGYKVANIRYFPERNINAILFHHENTGASHLHLECEDTNNVFMVTLKTSPTDSTGVAHVLEHTSLCGSKKYPIRDPFFNMIKRSLNTYMNAWTGADFTSYPFSSENYQDYFNLMAVYLDAVYFPLLERLDFLQEGHRLEHSQADDSTSSLQIKGIVYNEMKGAMAESASLFSYKMYNKLFPTITYQHNSGGDPADIPNLTHEQLKEFHQTHYHPSNTWVCTYGNFPIEPQLEFLNGVFGAFQKIDPNTDIPDEVRFTAPQQYKETAPVPPMSSPDENHGKYGVSFLLNKNTDVFTSTSMHILSSLLLNGLNAPFYQSLIESNLGNNFSPGTGYDDSTREAVFSVGLQGIKAEDIPQIDRLIFETLEKVAREGFSQERIDGVLHQVEIKQRHIGSNFGLHLAAAVMHPWIHGGSPFAPLGVYQTVEVIKEEIKKGGFFEGLIRKHLLNNPHQVKLTMMPDENFVADQIRVEEEKVKAIEQNLTPEQLSRITAEAAQLKLRQDEKQDPSVLPTITLNDIEREKPVDEMTRTSVEGASVQWNVQPTNGLVYLQALISAEVPDDLLPYIPLFCQILTSLGTKKLSLREFAQKAELFTGRLSTSPSLILNQGDVNLYSIGINLSSYCLERNLAAMFELWSDLFNDVVWDEKDHIKTQMLADSLIDNGHSYAQLYAASCLSEYGVVKDRWEGIQQFKLIQSAGEDIDALIAKFKRLSKIVLNKNSIKFRINTEKSLQQNVENHLKTFLQSLPAKSDLNVYNREIVVPDVLKTFIGIPSDINHTALCFPTVVYTHPDYAKLQVLGYVMTNGYLHREIREKGGAYGGGARQSRDGVLSCYSYRDPNTLDTIEHFRGAIDWVSEGKYTEENIVEAKLNVFSAIDRPVPPSMKGSEEFYYGIDAAARQLNRNRLFAIQHNDVKEVAAKYLNSQKHSIAVFGSDQNADLFKEKGWNCFE